VPDGRAFDQHDVRPQDVVRRHVAVRHDVHVRQIPPAQEHVRLHTIGEHEHLLVAHTEPADEAEQRLRARRVVRELIDHVDRVLARPRIERALARERAHLARHVLVVGARVRPEHRSTANPVWRTGRALTRATCSLLLPGLLVTAHHEPASFRRGVALTLVGEERLHRLVHHRHVHGPVEQRLGQAHALARGALRRVRGGFECRRICHGR